jgi:hypothetical protein
VNVVGILAYVLMRLGVFESLTMRFLKHSAEMKLAAKGSVNPPQKAPRNIVKNSRR